MNESLHLTPDDPRLTAYALGELEGDERAAVAAAVAADPGLQAAVADIRGMTQQLEEALAAETTEAATAPVPVTTESEPDADRYATPGNRTPKLIFLNRLLWIGGGLAAAGLALVLSMQPTYQDAAGRQESAEMAAIEQRRIASEQALKMQRPAYDSATVSSEPRRTAQEAAQSTPASAPTPIASGTLTTVSGNLMAQSPIVNVAEQDENFTTNTVGTGSRLALDSQDVPAAYSVINRQYIDALGITSMQEAGSYVSGGANTAPGGSNVAFSAGTGSMRNFYSNSTASTDSYMVESFDFGRAPNATVFAGPPGVGVRGGGGRGGRGTVVNPYTPPPNTESYALRVDNTFKRVTDEPLSTFSIDVDTASYANVRRFLNQGQLPPTEAVRVEEMVNYFPYRYEAPTPITNPGQTVDPDVPPFAATLEVASAPWDSTHRLVRVGLKGREVATEARPRANLVFLLDVSGSMSDANKLPLVKESMRLLLRRLREDDRVAIVVYAGASGMALPSTQVSRSAEILNAIDRLTPGGSTNGASGIQLAYDIAQANFIEGGINRVILCTDGDFNVGITNQGDLLRLVQDRAESDVFLTVLGYGMGNLKDSTLEMLADRGNGNYGYIDNRREAEKLLADQVNGTLVTIAKDVKIQVEFNPNQVVAYKLIGYENRLLAPEDFNNDAVDAGEIGAGHTVTALYEIVPAAGAGMNIAGGPAIDELRYQPQVIAQPTIAPINPALASEMLTVKVRYKEPTGDVSRRLDFPLTDRETTFGNASADFRFAAAVAGFGLALREAPVDRAELNRVLEWAADGLRDDPQGYRAEFADLVRRAQSLSQFIGR